MYVYVHVITVKDDRQTYIIKVMRTLPEHPLHGSYMCQQHETSSFVAMQLLWPTIIGPCWCSVAQNISWPFLIYLYLSDLISTELNCWLWTPFIKPCSYTSSPAASGTLCLCSLIAQATRSSVTACLVGLGVQDWVVLLCLH